MFVLVCSKKVSEQKRTWAQLETVQRQIELINGLLELVQVLLWSPLSSLISMLGHLARNKKDESGI